MVKSPPYTTCGNAYNHIWLQDTVHRLYYYIEHPRSAIAQSVVATWQCMSNKSPPFILVIAFPGVSVGLRLDHSYMVSS